MSDSTPAKDAIVIERTFNAPIDLIWQMWTVPDHLKNWYGPQGFTVSVAEWELRVGGKRRVCMEMQTPDGKMEIWTMGEFTELVPQERLAYTDIPADKDGNAMLINGETLTTVVTVLLEAVDGRTKTTMTHAGLPAGEEGASEGWKQAADKLADYVQTIQDGR